MNLGIYAALVVGALLSICGISSAIHVDLSSGGSYSMKNACNGDAHNS